MSDAKQHRNGRFIASAAIIGLIVLAGIIAIVLRLAGGDSDPTGQAGPPSPSQGAASTSACGLPDGESTSLEAAPDAEWRIVGTSALPSAEDIGPESFTGGVPKCFSRSPSGALFAATWLTGLLNEPEYATPELAQARIAPGAALDAFLADTDSATKVAAQVAGYRIEDYSPDRATVSVVMRLSDGPDSGGLLQIVMTMAWEDGDWLWQLSDAGIQGNALSSLGGFTPWSGV